MRSVTGAGDTVITVVTVADTSRFERVAMQHKALRSVCPEANHGMVALGGASADGGDIMGVDGVQWIGSVGAAAGQDRPHLAAARNMAGDWAAEQSAPQDEPAVVMFLDADCLPTAELCEYSLAYLRDHPHSVVAGPVTYLPKERSAAVWDRAAGSTGPGMCPPWVDAQWIDPHPARSFPPAGQARVTSGSDANLFWSLSFATTAAMWRSIRRRWGGFDETFVGYGGEDTDFGWQLRAHGDQLVWLGGAHAVHVWHPVSSPPWEHLHDIVDNANRFHAKWGQWPMEGWLREFARAGAIRQVDGRWRVVDS